MLLKDLLEKLKNNEVTEIILAEIDFNDEHTLSPQKLDFLNNQQKKKREELFAVICHHILTFQDKTKLNTINFSNIMLVANNHSIDFLKDLFLLLPLCQSKLKIDFRNSGLNYEIWKKLSINYLQTKLITFDDNIDNKVKEEIESAKNNCIKNNKCGILLEIPLNPVIPLVFDKDNKLAVRLTSVYERTAIEEWVKTGNTTDPNTRETIVTLIPNIELQQEIKKYFINNPQTIIEQLKTVINDQNKPRLIELIHLLGNDIKELINKNSDNALINQFAKFAPGIVLLFANLEFQNDALIKEIVNQIEIQTSFNQPTFIDDIQKIIPLLIDKNKDNTALFDKIIAISLVAALTSDIQLKLGINEKIAMNKINAYLKENKITSLDLKGYVIFDVSFAKKLIHILKNNPQITDVCNYPWANNNINDNDSDHEKMVEEFRDHLNRNKILASDVSSREYDFSYDKIPNFYGNSLGYQAGTAIAELLKKPNCKSIFLNLTTRVDDSIISHLTIRTHAVKTIIGALKNNKTITLIYLGRIVDDNGLNGLDEAGALILLETLKTNTTISILELAYQPQVSEELKNKINDHITANKLRDLLLNIKPDTNKLKIDDINLGYCIGDKSAQLIKEFINQHPEITQVKCGKLCHLLGNAKQTIDDACRQNAKFNAIEKLIKNDNHQLDLIEMICAGIIENNSSDFIWDKEIDEVFNSLKVKNDNLIKEGKKPVYIENVLIFEKMHYKIKLKIAKYINDSKIRFKADWNNPSVHLKDIKFGDENAPTIVELLQKNPHVTKITSGKIRLLSHDSIEAICKEISINQTIVSQEIAGCFVKQISRNKKENRNNFSVDLKDIKFNDEGVPTIIELLNKHPDVTKLTLAEKGQVCNKLSRKSLKALDEAIKHNQKVTADEEIKKCFTEKMGDNKVVNLQEIKFLSDDNVPMIIEQLKTHKNIINVNYGDDKFSLFKQLKIWSNLNRSTTQPKSNNPK